MRIPAHRGLKQALRKTALSLAIAGSLLLGHTSAHAWGIVFDPTNFVQNLRTAITSAQQSATQALQYGKQAEQYINQAQQLRQLISTLQNLSLSSLLPGSSLQKITDKDAFVNQACPVRDSMAGQLVSAAINLVAPQVDLMDNLAKSQLQLCKSIAGLQADKYNATLDMLEHINQEHGGAFSQIDSLLSNVNSLANIQQGVSLTQKTMGAISNEMNNWNTRVESYNNSIKTLQSLQSQLSKVTMQGHDNLMGKAVQATALAGALAH